MEVHAGAVVHVEGLGHEGGDFAVACGGLFGGVFVVDEFVSHAEEMVVAEVDFALASGGDFVMVAFNFDAEAEEGADDVVAEIGEGIDGWGGKVAFAQADLVALVFGAFLAAVPDAFDGIDGVTGLVDGLFIADGVEDEELGFGSEAGFVGDAAFAEPSFAFSGDGAWVAGVFALGDGVADVAAHGEGGSCEKRVDDGGFWEGDEEHVGFVEALPAADGGAVESDAVGESSFGEFGGGVGAVLG